MNKIFGLLAILAVLIGAFFFLGNNAPEDNSAGGYGGLTVAEAQALAQSRGVMFRVVEIDGAPQPTTKDYRPGRVNAEIENNTVIGYTIEN